MIKNTKNLSFTFSPKALLSVVPTVVSYEIQEFLFSLGSLVSLYLVFVSGSYLRKKFTTLEKQENYINFEDFTYTKFNCLTVLKCRTNKLHYLFLKELFYYYTNMFSLFKLKPLKILVSDYIRQPSADLVSDSLLLKRIISCQRDSSPTTRVGGFLRRKYKFIITEI